jgi:arylsulfatase A-like enzyme
MRTCICFIFFVLGLANLSSAAEAVKKPNILFIVADDLGWGDVGWHGSRIKTPVMDGLVKAGVELDQHYVQPLCTPTRAALLSGRYPGRFGPQALTPTNLRVFPMGTETLASALKSIGYDTSLAGKWHLGSRIEWSPNHYGFDRSYGSLCGAVDPWMHTYRKGPYEKTWHRDNQLIDEEGNATELVDHEVLGWIKANREPWFIYVPFQAVHIPVDAPDEYKKIYANEKYYDDPVKDESFKRYAAYTSQMDAKIGEFIAALEATGQREDTLIVFTSDNGALTKGGNPYVSKVPPTPVLGTNKPWRGNKGSLYEGGIHVPAFANWPGHLAARKVTQPMHVVDWMPTLTKLAGYVPTKDLHWDGQDVWPMLNGAAPSATPRTIYWAFNVGDALRVGDWKLIEWRKKGSKSEPDKEDVEDVSQDKNEGKGRTELFNLAKDPTEMSNLVNSEPARVAQMHSVLETMRAGDVKKLPQDLIGIKP